MGSLLAADVDPSLAKRAKREAREEAVAQQKPPSEPDKLADKYSATPSLPGARKLIRQHGGYSGGTQHQDSGPVDVSAHRHLH